MSLRAQENASYALRTLKQARYDLYEDGDHFAELFFSAFLLYDLLISSFCYDLSLDYTQDLDLTSFSVWNLYNFFLSTHAINFLLSKLLKQLNL